MIEVWSRCSPRSSVRTAWYRSVSSIERRPHAISASGIKPTRKNARQPSAVSCRPTNARIPTKMPPSVFIDATIPSVLPRCSRGNSSTTIVIATAHSAPRNTWAPNCATVSHEQARGQRRQGGCRGVADDRDQQQSPAPDAVRLPRQEERRAAPHAVMPRIHRRRLRCLRGCRARGPARTPARSCRIPRRTLPRTAGRAACAGTARRGRSPRRGLRRARERRSPARRAGCGVAPCRSSTSASASASPSGRIGGPKAIASRGRRHSRPPDDAGSGQCSWLPHTPTGHDRHAGREREAGDAAADALEVAPAPG